jgi:hypothetical protein
MTAPADRDALAEHIADATLIGGVWTAKAVLAAIEAAGCVVVPAEPTEAMWRAAGWPENTAWPLMLAASPYRRTA